MYNFVTKKDLLTQKETSPISDNYGVVITRKKEREGDRKGKKNEFKRGNSDDYVKWRISSICISLATMSRS